ncbi:MAG: D-aminoacyl-tRNA deacylase [Candidatus Peregrinibacteria bacterium]|nr:D-aminoacyl-tRNA deacylase [Candidatus Peregrinibacteria bacterium]
MKVVLQKSGSARVEIENKIHGEIKSGIVLLIGITHDDNEKDIEYLVEKITNLRIFESEGKYFEKSILEVSEEILAISQFTLYASCRKGRRPDFIEAAKPEVAKPLYDKFIEKLKEKGIKVQTGVFGADMQVHLVNQGPITLIIDSKLN